MQTLKEVYDYGSSELKKAEVPDYGLDTFYLMEVCFGITRAQFYCHPDQKVESKALERFLQLIESRKKRIPLQYIIGKREFMGLDFLVNQHVLIPRQETELLVEEVLKYSDNCTVLDLCTGSGCIAISIAKFAKNVKIDAVDISEKALEVADKNVKNNNVSVELIKSDLFEKIDKKYDIIVSNPPYIATQEIDKLEPEVRVYEPMLALDGQEDGLYFYKKIIEQAGQYLKQKGRLFFEIGYDQGESVSEILQDAGFYDIKVMNDLSGCNRMIMARYV